MDPQPEKTEKIEGDFAQEEDTHRLARQKNETAPD